MKVSCALMSERKRGKDGKCITRATHEGSSILRAHHVPETVSGNDQPPVLAFDVLLVDVGAMEDTTAGMKKSVTDRP